MATVLFETRFSTKDALTINKRLNCLKIVKNFKVILQTKPESSCDTFALMLL